MLLDKNDSKSYINDNELSLNDSCVEELAGFTDIKKNNASYIKQQDENDNDDEEFFTKILEVDEEYLGSN